jgi:hypothetical protein
MARGRGRGAQTRGRGKPVKDYYEGLPSDADYMRTAHQRAVHQARNTWLIRLLVVALLAGAVRLWGADVMRLVQLRLHQTGNEVKAVGGNITEGRDRRSGAGLEEGQ